MNSKYLIWSLVGIVSVSILIMQLRHCPVVFEKNDKQEETTLQEETKQCVTSEGNDGQASEQATEPLIISEKKIVPEETTEQTKREITVKNEISEKMITYTKGFMHYVPEFSVTINDIPLARGKEERITIDDNKLVVEYKYNFYKGYKTGLRRTEFIIPQNKDTITLNFSWKDDWRVIIPGAQPHKILAEES